MSKAAELANLIGNINAGGGGVNRNVIINGAMNCSQRSTSVTGLGANTSASTRYQTIDRFGIDVEGTTAGRYTMTQDSSAPSGFANSLKLACTTADTSIGAAELVTLSQIVEGQNVQSFAKGTSDAKPFAVSFYVKGNASATYVCELFDGDNTRHVASTFSVTTDWARVSISFPADTTGAFDDDNAASLYLQIFLHAGSNFSSGTLPATWASKTNANRAAGGGSFFDSTSRTFFITGVQLEVGQNPTSFEHKSFAQDLHECGRYYQLIASGTNKAIATGPEYNSSTAQLSTDYPLGAMRDAPSIDQVNGGDYYLWHGGGVSSGIDGAFTIEHATTVRASFYATPDATVSSDGQARYLKTNNSAAYFAFKSEL
jgi:hypothetical protein